MTVNQIATDMLSALYAGDNDLGMYRIASVPDFGRALTLARSLAFGRERTARGILSRLAERGKIQGLEWDRAWRDVRRNAQARKSIEGELKLLANEGRKKVLNFALAEVSW